MKFRLQIWIEDLIYYLGLAYEAFSDIIFYAVWLIWTFVFKAIGGSRGRNSN